MPHKKRIPIPPGEMLKEGFLDEMGISQLDLAKHLSWTPAKVNEIIQGKRRVTVEIALSLADAFDVSPEFWLNIQLETDLYQAQQKHKKYPPIQQAS